MEFKQKKGDKAHILKRCCLRVKCFIETDAGFNPTPSKVLNALFNLCKINKRRQEQAAENGIIPHLMNFIMSDSPLKPHALPLLCDMAHASRNSREQLRAHGGLDVYLSLLDDMVWSVTALDSIAVCLAHDNDNHKVEQALLKKDAVQRLVKFFQCCPEQQFVHILEPFLKIITKSSRINTTLAVNGLTPLLIARLDHQDAIARLNLLKLIKDLQSLSWSMLFKCSRVKRLLV
ncbi:hypothetical protein OIU78_022752 [Salix suchowensis]|nr:hypothetical protein OIU78_022752 [Salix suchowensis]